jgi:RNA polymerase sigma-70 factor (ECF subfamily)
MPPDQPDGVREIDNAWIREHYPRIHRAAWLMTGDPCEAEDLAQETFVVALEQWNKFEGRSSESTWLYGILMRLSQRRGRSLARMRRRLMNYVDRNNVIESEDPQTRLAREQWRKGVWADVARLPQRQRVAVTLRFAEGMSYEQIGEAIGCAPGTVKSRIHHGIKRLRQRLAGDLIEGSAEGSSHMTSDLEVQPAIHIASRS